MLKAETVVAATRIEHFIGQYVTLKPEGRDLKGLCPFHDEKTPSFVVHPKDQFFKCFGCGAGGDVIDFAKLRLNVEFQEALEAVAEFSRVSPEEPRHRSKAAASAARRLPDEPEPGEGAQAGRGPCVATYTYQDANGGYLYEIRRHEPGADGKKKDFSQCYRNSFGKMIMKGYPNQVLYRLPAVTTADEVFLVEGEKDADTVARLGYVGTTAPGGSNAKFSASMAEALAGKLVYLMPDNDPAGQKRGEQLTGLLKELSTVIQFPAKAGKDITDWVEAAGDAAVKEAIEQIRKDSVRERLKGPLSIEEIMQRYEGGYAAFCDPSKRPKGIQTGFGALDSRTRGMFPGNLIIVAARPGMGKTAFAMNVAVNVCKKNIPVCVFSLEMSSEDLLTRAVCGDAHLDNQDFGHNKITEADRKRFGYYLNMLAQLPIKIDDQSAASLKYIRSYVEKQKPKLVVVDYLGLMTGVKAENRVQQVTAITTGLKAMAKDLRLPVLLVAQLNRSTETRPSGNNVPQLSDLRESGSIEQDADQVWFVYRKEYYKPNDESLKGLADIIIAKNRGGPLGTAKLNWLGKYTKFVEPVHNSDYEPGEYS